MKAALKTLVDLMNLEEIEVDHFRGESPSEGWQRVFGGQVIGQALTAALRTVEHRPAHSLHAYFIRPGDPQIPILYEVDRIRDGKSFATRRITAIQRGRPIFTLSASFQKHEPGLTHQVAAPSVPDPESLPSWEERKKKLLARTDEQYHVFINREMPIEIRPVDPYDEISPTPRAPVQTVWFKTTDPLGDDLPIHQCALAYASDYTLLDTTLYPHGISFHRDVTQMASLDHAMWFHQPFRADQWLLYVQECPSTDNARGFARGSIYARDGVLIASVAQEGLVRAKVAS